MKSSTAEPAPGCQVLMLAGHWLCCRGQLDRLTSRLAAAWLLAADTLRAVAARIATMATIAVQRTIRLASGRT